MNSRGMTYPHSWRGEPSRVQIRKRGNSWVVIADAPNGVEMQAFPTWEQAVGEVITRS